METVTGSLERKVLLNGQYEALLESSECADASSNDEAHPVFKNGLILGVVFRFLSFEELKQCRAVNKCWNVVSKTIFQSKTHVVFNEKKTLKLFLLDFQEKKINCGRYIFRRVDCLLSEFLNVIRRDSTALSSLELDCVTFNDAKGTIHKYDLGELLEEHKMLNHLNVSCEFTIPKAFRKCLQVWGFTMMIVPQQNLLNIKYLTLSKCVVILGEDLIHCTPKEVKLIENVYCSTTEEELQRVVANDFLDIKHVDKMTISQQGMKYFYLNLLDTREHPMSLARLCGVTFTISTDFKLKRLCMAKQDINISMLPSSLEGIEFHLEATNRILESFPAFNFNRFTNLKELYCYFVNEISPLLSKFSACPKLHFVKLQKQTSDDVPLKLNWLPSSLKILTLGNVGDIWDDEEQGPTVLNVNTLILHCYAYENSILNVIRKLRAENLYIIFHWVGQTSEKSQICRTILKERLFGEYFTVGAFEWRNEDEFINDPLSSIVDSKSRGYCFQSLRDKEGVDTDSVSKQGPTTKLYSVVHNTVKNYLLSHNAYKS